MASLNHSSLISERLLGEPELKYLDAFMRDPRLGNNACKNRQKLASDVVILERRDKKWHKRTWNVGRQPWERPNSADGYAIVMNYLDPKAIHSLTEGLGIDARVFRAHIDGCEQHYTGDWSPSNMTSPPYLPTDQYQSHFVSLDYRRRYAIKNERDFAAFDSSRKERSRFLRSHHSARSANALFEHERCTIAWIPTSNKRSWGALVVLCDPGIGDLSCDAMLRRVEASIQMLPPTQIFNRTIVQALSGLIGEIIALWNDVTFYADINVSALEDQLEHDFWDKPRNPVTILHEAQRLSRNLTRYRNQLISMENDLAFSSGSNTPVNMTTDLNEIKARLETLVRRTDKAVPALLASIAINESSKASSLTAVALWFAPLSLSVSIVGIDGNGRFGGKKYWIWACIALPLLVIVILVANSSDRFINRLGERRRGRALLAIFKPETRIR